jgi:hypothetical protein
MYTREEIWNSFAKEFRIIKHLAEKIPTNQHNYKPTEVQRSTLELLQYLSMTGASTMKAIVENDVTAGAPYREASTTVTLENFAERITTNESDMAKLFISLLDTDLDEEIERFGVTATRAVFILDLLKTITAYKMQLFLYIKASGNHSVVTSNLWGGVDSIPKS